MEEDWFLRIMTFNLQLLFDPGEALGDWNEGAEIRAKAEAIADAFLALKEGDRPDVLCFNEVFYVVAFDILRERLGGDADWPNIAFSAHINGERVGIGIIAGGVGAALIGGGDPLTMAAGMTLGGLLGGPLYSDMGGNPGVMILSRASHPFEKIEELRSGNQPGDAEFIDCGTFNYVLAHYSDNVESDASAWKGFIVVRVHSPRHGSVNILSTHMQASYEDECFDDKHYGDEDCRLHADTRRRQIDQIVRTLSYTMPWDQVANTIITGDLNIRGEQDKRSFVRENGAEIDEWSSIFRAVVTDRFRPANLERYIDGWHAHTHLPEGVVPGDFLVDDGVTNINDQYERGQRLDYLAYPKSELFRLEPHSMRIRFAGLSDHRSVEAMFGLACDYDMPSKADVVASHQPYDLGGIKTITLYHRRPEVAERLQPRGKPVSPQRFDWSLADIRDYDRCLLEVAENGSGQDPKTYCSATGRVPGTYAIAAFVEEEEQHFRELESALDLFYADNLSRPARVASETHFSFGEAVFDTGSLNGPRRAKLDSATYKILSVRKPLYCRILAPAGVSTALILRHFTGDTCPTSIVAPAWRHEMTAWPEPGNVGGSKHVRWYLCTTRRNDSGKPYECRFMISNPKRNKITWQVLEGACNGTQLLEDGKPLLGSADDAEIVVKWTADAAGGDARILLDWHDTNVDMREVTVRFEPGLSYLASKPGLKRLRCRCVEETPGLGSDEILLRLYLDKKADPDRTIEWDNVDSGKSLPGAGSSPNFWTLIDDPVSFSEELRFTVTEWGDHSGRDRGEHLVNALNGEEDDVVVERTFPVGGGRYRLTGVVCRDPE